MIITVMKRKSTRKTLSNKKVLLLSVLLFAFGFFMLLFSILIKNPSIISDINITQIEPPTAHTSDTEINTEKEEALQSDETLDIPEKEIEVKPAPIAPPVIEKTKSGTLVFIFDDGGHQTAHTEGFVDLPFPVTIAVLPGLADSLETANLVRQSGNEVFLHQPMQAMNLNLDPGPGAIFPTMTTGEAAAVLRNNLSTLGPVEGVNNHEGSLITSDRNLMGAILDVCIDEGVLFLDSRTTAQTVVPMVALERGFEVPERDVFLDNSQDENEMRKMIQQGLDIADKQGYAIMIGHVTSPALATVLEDMYEEIVAQGYTFSTPSKLKI